MSRLGIGKLGVGIALLAALLAATAATASAHGYGGYGMPMMGYGYQWADAGRAGEELKEVTGKVVAMYPMSVKLDSGYYIRMPWWFAEEIGIEKDAAVKAKGFSYGKVVVPTYIEVNGEGFGDEGSAVPVWMQGFDEGYGYGYHCPMMGW